MTEAQGDVFKTAIRSFTGELNPSYTAEEEKKEQAEKPQARTFLKDRLAAKQTEVAQGKKDSKEQEKSKNTHREM